LEKLSKKGDKFMNNDMFRSSGYFSAVLFLAAMLMCSGVQGQSEIERAKSESHDSMSNDGKAYYEGMIQSYFDPEFPVKKEGRSVVKDDYAYHQAMLRYAESHPPFPVYNNTGNPEEDQATYEEACNEWFRNNPHFPQYIDTGHPEDDRERFEKARREWINRYPKKYRELYELVTSDNELEKTYSFVLVK
jgi:hypothetical protein